LVTRATVEEAHESARRAAERVPATREALTHAEGASSAARRFLSGAVEALSRARNELQVLEGDESRTRLALETRGTQIPALDDEVAVALDQSRVLEEELADLRGRLPELADAVENAEARARAQRASLEEVRRIEAEASSAESAAQRLSADVAARRAVMEKRHAEIEARLAGRSREREEAAQRRLALEHDLVALARLNSLVERALDDVRRSHEVITSTYREQLEASRASAERLEALRRERRAVEEAQSILQEARRRDEVELAELAVKVDGVYEAVRRDLAKEPTALTETEIETPEGVTLENYVGDLEAKITSLGPINPLALEELAELEERYRELDTQVADVRHARREILEVLRALDDEIMTSFSAAVADVNEHFSTLISMLFPGGQGRLILTDPDDPLTTGVEIEVRPMGRNVRRISLLSGGERSMAALAFLFAIFRSRPSPFYMMDEVEAALDDVNLQRFLNLVDEFRHEAQLLIVTHQKRTMESADALYGVTMVPGASSKVVSQRQRREVEVVP
ncbi:MAG: AAA family ATPase, partial [Acidimicrobiaceae bacterium]|nr:AAA family ATPase [Acidimicrobiaceae bacterium]